MLAGENMTPKEIIDKINKLSKEVFEFDFQEYLLDSKRDFWGLTIDNINFKHNVLFGNPDSDIVNQVNRIFQQNREDARCEAGYRVDVGSYFRNTKIQADVFLINLDRLNDSIENLDALLLHELCHMVIDSKMIEKKLAHYVNSKDIYHGKRLYKKTDRYNERYTRHTEEFCIILSAASQRAGCIYEHYNGRWDVIDRAMKHGDISR